VEQDFVVLNRGQAFWTNWAGTSAAEASGSVQVSLIAELTRRIYPVPFSSDTAVRGTLKFDGLPSGSTVRIYTTRGLRVWEGEVAAQHLVEWNGRNEAGQRVAPGVYLWVVEEPDHTKHRGQLLVQ
jgi:hypothetical protein